MQGTNVGNYRVVRKLSEGGMGSVYEAVHAQLGKRAVLKALRPELAHRAEFVQRLFDEARAVNLVEHPGLVDVFDCGQLPDSTAYILMEFLNGEHLGQRLKRAPLSLSAALRIGRQIASALTATHEKGIVHRDLKPDNIMLIADPEVADGERTKILDFGIAKVQADLGDSEETRHRTQTGALMGTPTYMSPEQCRGAGHVDERTDVYSLGVILYRMLAEKPPFVAEGAGEVMLMHMSEEPPPLDKAQPKTPPALVELVHSMLKKAREERPRMAEVAKRLEALTSQLSPRLAETLPPQLEFPTRRMSAVELRTAGASAVAMLANHTQTSLLKRALARQVTAPQALLLALGVLLFAIPIVVLILRHSVRPEPMAASAPVVQSQAPAPQPAAPPAPAPTPSAQANAPSHPASKQSQPPRIDKRQKNPQRNFPAEFLQRDQAQLEMMRF